MITREETRAIWEKVKANLATLKACTGPHDFQALPGEKLFPRYRCSKCGGEADGHAVHWYAAGLAHGRAHPQPAAKPQPVVSPTDSPPASESVAS